MRVIAEACLAILGLMPLFGAPAVAATAEPWRTLPEPLALPEPSSSGRVPINDIRMFYAVFGQGQPVLLLHGGLANSNYWGSVVPILVQHHFRVIVADSRGHGRSSRSGQPYSYELMASDVLGLLDYLKLTKVDLVGWSDGAIIGLEIAMQHPERLHRLFAYGANSDPTGIRDDVGGNPTFETYIERTRREYRELSPTPDEYASFLKQIQAMWAQQPNIPESVLRQIAVPTAIVDGAHDEAIKREHTEYLAHSIPGAELIILNDVSHFGMLQRPREFGAAVVEFLNSNCADPRGCARQRVKTVK
jgi:pimeloyl-ACP methyl ester carboxylesterase